MKLHELTEMSLPGGPQELSPEEANNIETKVYPLLRSTGHTSENLDIQTADLGPDGKFFALAKDGEVLTWLNVVEHPFPTDDKPTLWIKRSYTPTTKRNSGYSKALYTGLAGIGYRLVSDQQVAEMGAKQIWKGLETRGRVKHWDVAKKQYLDPNSTIDPYNHPYIFHVLEHEKLNVPELKSSILNEQTFWTHPDVVSGKFKI